MKKLLVMDAKNYEPSLEEFKRIAIRGIIFVDGKLLLIESKFGEVKCPGGGMEEGESDIDTLVRETLEETGYHVKLDSIREFGEVEEIRLAAHESMIWHQFNRYYFCDIKEIKEACKYTSNEKKYGFHQVWYTLDEALEINLNMLQREGINVRNHREYNVLKLIKEAITHE